jgi:hypothetical protein
MGGGDGDFDMPAVPDYPDPPEPPDPAPPPVTQISDDVKDAREDTIRKEARKRGRKKTILTGELGDANSGQKSILG